MLLLVLYSWINAQKGLDRIKKVYPKWTTDFNKRNIELDELFPRGPPKDGIHAIIKPKFTTTTQASKWLDKKEPVIYVKLNNIAKAYPLQILLFHEIVNDNFGNKPAIITFCPLCYSGIVYNTKVNGFTLRFGVSGLLRNSDLVMYDQLTESFWQQFTGEAIVGEMLGKKLQTIPSQIISFGEFKKNFSNGIVLSKNTGFKRPYGKNPYVNYDNIETTPFLFKGEIDKRLPQNEKVIGVRIQNISKIYPYSITSKEKIIHDNIGIQEIVIFHLSGTVSTMDKFLIKESKDVGATGVFIPKIDKLKLTFRFADGNIMDNQTNSIWNITGKAISGKLKGEQLKSQPHGDYFSFAWFAFNPNSKIYTK
jgi:hypothetical protein